MTVSIMYLNDFHSSFLKVIFVMLSASKPGQPHSSIFFADLLQFSFAIAVVDFTQAKPMGFPLDKKVKGFGFVSDLVFRAIWLV